MKVDEKSYEIMFIYYMGYEASNGVGIQENWYRNFLKGGGDKI